MKVFYRNTSVLGFQWDESEVIKGLPVQRRVPEVLRWQCMRRGIFIQVS